MEQSAKQYYTRIYAAADAAEAAAYIPVGHGNEWLRERDERKYVWHKLLAVRKIYTKVLNNLVLLCQRDVSFVPRYTSSAVDLQKPRLQRGAQAIVTEVEQDSPVGSDVESFSHRSTDRNAFQCEMYFSVYADSALWLEFDPGSVYLAFTNNPFWNLFGSPKENPSRKESVDILMGNGG